MAGVSFTGGGESEVNMSRRVSTSEDMSVSGKGPVQMAGKGADITMATARRHTPATIRTWTCHRARTSWILASTTRSRGERGHTTQRADGNLNDRQERGDYGRRGIRVRQLRRSGRHRHSDGTGTAVAGTRHSRGRHSDSCRV